MSAQLRCVQCQGALDRSTATLASCACGATYPVVDGIPIVMPRANATLHAYMTGLVDLEQDLGDTAARMQAALPGLSPALATRARAVIGAIEHDLGLMRGVYAPIEARAVDVPIEDDFIAWASIQTGLSLHDMFIYFYQDWYGTADFRQVKACCEAALVEHARDRASVAVLGAGACGLAHACGASFAETYAVDLSLPTLLLAQRFMAGEKLSVHLKQANFRRADLEPPDPLPQPVRCVVANVTNLPFADASLSVVITQCLLDIVDNPLQLAEEIQRVLRPGGLWLNFSHAFDAPGDPIELSPRKLDEIMEVLSPLGFAAAFLQRKRFVMLNPSALDPEPPRTDEEVHFFGLRKDAALPARAPFRELRTRFRDGDPTLWDARPAPVPGKEVSLGQRRSFGEGGTAVRSELRVGPYPMPIPADYAELLAGLLGQMDGRHTLRQIHTALCAQGAELTPAAFFDLIYGLSVERYLIDLRSR